MAKSPQDSRAGQTGSPASPFTMSWYMKLMVLLQALHVTPSGSLVCCNDKEKSDEVPVVEDTDTVVSPSDDVLSRTKLPKKLPSMIEIKKALPAHCFKSDPWLSLYFMAKDFFLIFMLYTVVNWTWEVLPLWTQLFITPLYFLLQGTMFTAVFIAGHDAGHGSFSNSEVLNTIAGNFCHTFLLCPYYMWKLSHRNHHKHTGNIDKDEVFYPVRKKDKKGDFLLHGFGLGIAWFAYLIKGYSPRNVYHFSPMDPMFQKNVLNCVISLAGIVGWCLCLFKYYETVGLFTFIYHYAIPEFIFGTYTVIITFLHHTDDDVAWYGDQLWDEVRGRLSSVDRSYGWCHNLLHNIGTHQIHHLFPKVPHYHLEEATAAFRKAFPNLVHIRSEPIVPAFYDMFRKYARQNVIDDNADLHMYK